MCIRTLFIPILALLTATPALACGTMDHWIQAYYGQGPLKRASQKQVLIGLYECAHEHYKPVRDDTRLVSILADAVRRANIIRPQTGGLKWASKLAYWEDPVLFDSLLEGIYLRYGCLSHSASHSDHSLLKKRLGASGCPRTNKE